ncbi:odv-e66 [Hemileuca sp. nucleopolyhedrovirus]|uniref:Odv-e66 n=1 Tax=Hemileuca sp. nucleopolyhedrovirus TaxID=1367203 RepID=S5MQ20_9ABAC|nr:odv-e66 [Hemileuca sp. nucleopolyhedrovirus]AGR56768.1 odv-e66 [Hemileuca sp. nucleopolyhedrovirus]
MFWTIVSIIVLIVIVLLIVFFVNDKNNYNASFVSQQQQQRQRHVWELPISDTESLALSNRIDLFAFEKYYLDTLQTKFLQKAEKIANPTRAFSNDGNVFVGLTPWTSVPDFGTLCHTLIGYGVRFRNTADSLYLNPDLADNLYYGVVAIYRHLPFPPPVNQAPWGIQAEWYHFSITMPEVFQNTCIVLRGFHDLDELVDKVFTYYLPLPTFSLGWWRTAGNAMRMCLPYAYGQLLRGYSFEQIKNEDQVRYVLDLINFPLVESGNGIHSDYVYFDHTDVRAYGYLINSYFTFDYYNYLFGTNTVNMYNVTNSISLIGSKQGLANPAVLSRNGAHFSNVLGYFIDYKNGVFTADFSKILTIRTESYFGSVVGQARDIAYYEADPTNNTHAPLWTMTRKIWANSGRVIRYRTPMLGIESGILLTTNLNGTIVVPTTGPSTSSFHPTVSYTAICATTNAGVMVMHVRLEELNLEFHSYTLYHRYGMFHLYDRIKSLTPLSNNGRCVILTKDVVQDTTEPRWTTASNLKSYNGVTVKHHNITNAPSFSNFVLRSLDNIGMQTIEQIISVDTLNRGTGMSCFSMLVQSLHEYDDTTVTRVEQNIFIIETNSSTIQCVIDFPIVILKDNKARTITINDATNVSTRTHRLDFDKILAPLSHVSLSIGNLQSIGDEIIKTDTSFYFENEHKNQFTFSF